MLMFPHPHVIRTAHQPLSLSRVTPPLPPPPAPSLSTGMGLGLRLQELQAKGRVSAGGDIGAAGHRLSMEGTVTDGSGDTGGPEQGDMLPWLFQKDLAPSL